MKIIGKYRELYKDSSFPCLKDNISETPIPGKDIILKHLRSGEIVAVSPSFITDVISGKKTKNQLMMMTDGVFEWRSDIVYYFDKYNLKLPDNFINTVL